MYHCGFRTGYCCPWFLHSAISCTQKKGLKSMTDCTTIFTVLSTSRPHVTIGTGYPIPIYQLIKDTECFVESKGHPQPKKKLTNYFYSHSTVYSLRDVIQRYLFYWRKVYFLPIFFLRNSSSYGNDTDALDTVTEPTVYC